MHLETSRSKKIFQRGEGHLPQSIHSSCHHLSQIFISKSSGQSKLRHSLLFEDNEFHVGQLYPHHKVKSSVPSLIKSFPLFIQFALSNILVLYKETRIGQHNVLVCILLISLLFLQGIPLLHLSWRPCRVIHLYLGDLKS